MPRGSKSAAAARNIDTDRATVEREHGDRIAVLFNLTVCDGCGRSLEDATLVLCERCREAAARREREDGPHMHRHAEERVRSRLQALLACSPALYFAHAEMRAAAGWAAPLAHGIAEVLSRPEAVIRAGRKATIASITGLIGVALGADDRAARPIAALCWAEYVAALEEHATAQRSNARRYVDDGRARLALTVHAVQLEGWAERLRALGGL
jgi:hypothetical protein